MTEILPLSRRVQAREVALPEATDGVDWRPATIRDLDAIMACEHAMNAVDHPPDLTNREEVEEDLTRSWVDLAKDTLLAIDDAGAVVGWGQVSLSQGQETAVRAILFGGIRPDQRERGLGRR